MPDSTFLQRGRGAVENRLSNRFDDRPREADGDWLDNHAIVDGEPAVLKTQVMIESPRTIITRNRSPDIPFDQSINAYRGCEHGCIYCFARPTHAFHNLSPGLDFESRLFAKPSAPALLRTELSKPSYRPALIAIGTNTDPFQPIEERFEITRGILEVLSEFNHPVAITTKSDRVVRNIDLLASMAERGLVVVALSVTSLDAKIARTLEPRAPTPKRRLAALAKLSAAGIPTMVAVAPVIPAITDHEIERILSAAADAGVRGAFYTIIRLPYEVLPLFQAWLAAHYPERAERVMSLIRSIRGGRNNDPDFVSRMRSSGPYAEMLRARFHLMCRRLGLNQDEFQLRTDLFEQPGVRQLMLL